MGLGALLLRRGYMLCSMEALEVVGGDRRERERERAQRRFRVVDYSRRTIGERNREPSFP